MPTDLGNLLIRVTSVGFDQVLQDLQNLESAMSRLGSNSALTRITQQLDQMNRYLKDMHGDLGKLALAQEKNGQAMGASQRQSQDAAVGFGKLGKVFKAVSATAAAFWVAVSVPKKFLQSMERIAAFNLSLANMAINANTTKASLVALGTVVEGLGGSRQGLASTMSRFQSDMQGLRMGRGGGNTMQVAALYGLDIRGSGPNRLATPDELMRNYAKLFEKMGNSELAKAQKLDIKAMAGFDDGTFRALDEGLEAWDANVKEQARVAAELKDADATILKITKNKAKVDTEWMIAERKMAAAMEPMATLFQDTSKWVAELAQKYPEIAGAAGLVWEALKRLGPAVLGVVTAFKLIGGAKAAASAAQAVAGVAGAAGGAAGTVGRIGRMAGALSAGAGVVNAVVGGVQRQVQIHSLTVMEQVITAWHGEWKAFTLLSHLGGNRDIMSNASFKKMLGENGIYDEKLQNAWLVAASNASKMNGYAKEINEDEYNRRAKEYANGKKGNADGITISNIQITVSSNSSNAEEVAKAVREELFRQINDAVTEGTKGVKMI